MSLGHLNNLEEKLIMLKRKILMFCKFGAGRVQSIHLTAQKRSESRLAGVIIPTFKIFFRTDS